MVVRVENIGVSTELGIGFRVAEAFVDGHLLFREGELRGHRRCAFPSISFGLYTLTWLRELDRIAYKGTLCKRVRVGQEDRC